MNPMDTLNKFLDRYKIIFISIAIIIFYIICIFNTNGYTCNSNLFFFLVILSVVHLTSEMFTKIINPYLKRKKTIIMEKEKIETSIKNFSSLNTKEKEFLWLVFFEKENRFFEYEIKNLIQNGYLEITQMMYNNTLKEPIVKLNNCVKEHLQIRFDQSIIDGINQLNENEKNIFNMFITEKEEGQFIHPIMSNETYECLKGLEHKKLINLIYEEGKRLSLYKNIKTFSLTSYSKQKFSLYSDKPIKRDIITIDLTKVISSQKGGSGSPV